MIFIDIDTNEELVIFDEDPTETYALVEYVETGHRCWISYDFIRAVEQIKKGE